MKSIVPEQLKPEQQAVEAAIRRAFAGVTRAGGVSWSESKVIDDYGSSEERAAARLLDHDTSWEQLADSPDWQDGCCGGSFCFLDAIGFRYYLPAAMVQAVRQGWAEWLYMNLNVKCVHPDYRLEQLSALSAEQLRVTAYFIRFMMAVENAMCVRPQFRDWPGTYESYWNRFDSPPVL